MEQNNNENKYLKEHPKAKKRFKIFGWIFLPLGIANLLIAIIDFANAMNSNSFEGPKLFPLFFVGGVFLMAGFICLSFGYMKEVNEYTSSQVAPVAKDVTNYMLDGTREEITKTVRSTSDVIRGTNALSKNINVCAKCGQENPIEAKFCSNCGSSIIVKCPKCGSLNDDGANFCNNCGEKLK